MDRQYKDSRIKWIGSIPESWKIYRIKYNTFLKGRIGWQGLNSNDFIDEGYCLITGTDFDNKGGINWNTCYRISKERFDEDELLHIKNGDLLMTKDGTIGKMAYIDNLPEEASLNSHLLIIRQITNLMNNKYLYWVMLSDVFVQFYNLFQSGTTMGSISQSTLGLFSTPCPPIPEQLRIANYLEEKCGEIDSLIGLQEQMIEKLKTYKQSVITEVVTKGLNPNVKLVPSGVDWIGEIPEGWKVLPIKRICRNITDGSHFSPSTAGEGKPYITVSNVYGDEVHVEEAAKISFDDFSTLVANGCQPPTGSVLLAKDGTVGRTAVVYDNDYVVLSSLGILTPSNTVLSKYLKYLLDSDSLQAQMQLAMAGSALRRITITKICKFVGLLPPLNEQQVIIFYLDEKCSDIDRLIEMKQQKIEKLKDYKKSIIYEAVTGKIYIDS